MIVRYRQDAFEAQFEPLRLARSLALRAMSVAARVVCRTLKLTARAAFEMSPQCGCAALDDVSHHEPLLRGKLEASMCIFAVTAEDVSDVERRSLCRAFVMRGVTHAAQVGTPKSGERTGRRPARCAVLRWR